jgi:hypothetical protein
MARRGWRAAGAALVAVAIGACGGSDYHYVHNGDEGVYLKLPEDWTRYEGDELLVARANLAQKSRLDLERDVRREWLVGFDGSDAPTPENVFNPRAAAPRGFVSVRALGRDERDVINLSTLRRLNFPMTSDGEQVDPVEFVRENPDGPIEIHDHGELLLDDGTHGYYVVAEIAEGPGEGNTYMFQQIVAIDPEFTRIYVVTIGCLAVCYLDNVGLINEVVASWGLEES